MQLLFDGADDAAVTLVLAHGAGAGMRHAWMQAMATALAARGLRVARFEFPYMRARADGKRRGPDRLPVLQAAWREAFAAIGAARVAVGGKSMGGRIATMVADELGALATVAFGYPFHPPGKPQQLRTAHLATMRTPLLILQGERDAFGKPEEVATYRLADTTRVQWLADGDHSFLPRKKSGHTAAEHLATAAAAAAAFVLGES